MERAAPRFSMFEIATLIVWGGCVAVGLLGFVLPYARPLAPRKELPVVRAEVLHVELTSDPLSPVIPKQELTIVQPPVAQKLPVPSIPRMTSVAQPSAVAFALPVEGPVAIVEPARASFNRTVAPEPPAPVAPPVQVLTYGQGEGRQPAPEYPFRAKREGQEGIVAIRFSVGEDGRVLAAEAVSPSPWKLLNDAALRVIRERWRFTTGPARLYEVSIRFQLTK